MAALARPPFRRPAATPRHFAAACARPLLLAALLALAGTLPAQVAINSTGAAPAGNAMLDISDLSKGLLVPRMTRSQRMAIPSITPPAYGLLVYQTDSATSDVPGYYYYDFLTPSGGWKHLHMRGAAWYLGGNAGTTSANFIGSLNAQPVVLQTGNRDQGRITDDGRLQFYRYLVAPPASTERVFVGGAIKLNGGSATPDHEGTIRYVPGSGGNPGQFQGYVANTPATDGTMNGWMQLDNNFYERKNQETANTSDPCADPTNTSLTPGAVTSGPRRWPIPGPTTGFITFSGPSSPFYTVWEDSRRQWLFRQADLAIAGICPGPTNPIRAIAFNASGVSGGTGRIHFLRFQMKNTLTNAVTGFDPAGSFTTFAQPGPPDVTGPTPSYTNTPSLPGAYPFNHSTGYSIISGWNVFPWEGTTGTGFVWTGNNLLIDAALDNQEWTNPSIQSANIEGYGTSYPSEISMFCDACGNPASASNSAQPCKWTSPAPAGFSFPPTTPWNGQQGTNSNARGWGWVSGWDLNETTNTIVCDGDPTTWEGGGDPDILNRLPRVAFLAKYTGGGVAYNVGNYMVAQEGLMVGDAAWAAAPGNFRGPGTLNAERSLWSGTTLLTDYVFDLYYDGQAKPEDSRAAGNYVRVPLRELPNYVEQQRRLPNVDGRNAWDRTGPFPVDQVTNQLWRSVEDQALYIQELNARMDALRQYLVEQKLKALEKVERK